jgi:hypothetical protein
MIFVRSRASPPIDGQLGHYLLHMQLETWLWGVLVSAYWCSSYRVTKSFSSLGSFSSSSIGGHVTHPIADCETPLLCLLGPGIASQETAISELSKQRLFLEKSKVSCPQINTEVIFLFKWEGI